MINKSSGACGLAFIQNALSSSPAPELKLFVRTPGKIPEDIASRTRVIQGHLGDQKALEEAMHGVDAVVSLLVRSFLVYTSSRV